MNVKSSPTRVNQKRSSAGIIWALLTAVFAASLLLPLPEHGKIAHLPSICLFYTLTGLPCPACGLSRSFVCLGHGQWQESLHWHPLGGLVFGVLFLLWLRCGAFWLAGITLLPLTTRASGRLSYLTCATLLLTGILRIGWLSAHHVKF